MRNDSTHTHTCARTLTHTHTHTHTRTHTCTHTHIYTHTHTHYRFTICSIFTLQNELTYCNDDIVDGKETFDYIATFVQFGLSNSHCQLCGYCLSRLNKSLSSSFQQSNVLPRIVQTMQGQGWP